MSFDATIILASKSAARRAMLKNAGLSFDAMPANIDEGAITKTMQDAGSDIKNIALELAQQKALHISKSNPEALVIGSDQILEFEGALISKADSPQAARAKLEKLSGKSHALISAVTIARGSEILWSNTDSAHLTMRDISNDALDTYCARAGDALVNCVGAYELEGIGSWLFSEIKGDYFTILGMPLLPVLGYLSEKHGIKP